MATLKGKSFQVYTYDTADSVRERLASRLDSIPRYIYMPSEAVGKLSPVDLLQEIKDDTKDKIDITPFLDKNKDIINYLKLDPWEDVAKVWVAYNIPISKVEDLRFQVETDLKELFNNKKVSNYINDTYDQEAIKKKLEAEIKAVKKLSIDYENKIKKFERIKGVSTSSTILDKMTFSFRLNVKKEITLLEVFNRIVLNRYTPFATINSFYKILKDFTPPDSWVQSSNEKLIVYTTESLNPKPEDYQSVSIIKDDEGYITVYLKLSTKGTNLKQKEFISLFMSSFKDVDNDKNINILNVSGVFNIPKFDMDMYIFLDLVMNHPIFSMFISINESEKSTKEKSDIHIRFNHSITGLATANITDKIMTIGDPTMKNVDTDLFPVGSPYVRFKITAKSGESADVFKSTLSKLFQIYNDERESITNFYKQYISFPVKRKRKEIVEKIVKKAKDGCLYNPTIINNFEVENTEFDVMRYPKDDPSGNNFICEYDDRPYPGLISTGKKKNPYIPCCFETDQLEDEESAYNKYFGQEVAIKESSKRDIIITNKFVMIRQFGELPKNITKTFDYAVFALNIKFLRKGVMRGKSSFLNCVLEAIKDTRDTAIGLEDDVNQLDEWVNEKRMDMATPEYASLCRQECYDMSITDILAIIKDPDVYLDPKLFIRMVEEYYNVDIYLFTRSHYAGELRTPRHTQSYYRNHRKPRDSIFIYEHLGSKNKAEYPQCELIIRFNTTAPESANTSYIFPPGEYKNLIGKIDSISRIVSKSYSLNVPVVDNIFSFSKAKILGQVIDTYGKTRRVDLSYDGISFSLFTDPLQPLYAKEIKSPPIRIDIKDAVKIAEYLNLSVSLQTVIYGVAKELIATLGNINVVLPLIDSKPKKGIEKNKEGLMYPENNISLLETYNKNKKVARYIQEYLFYLFSNYIKVDNILTMKDLEKALIKFSKKKIVINPNFIYEDVAKTFSDISGVLDKGRIVANNDDMIKRLLFVLKMKWLRERDILSTYNNREMLIDYYVDATDFDKIHTQVILEGDPSVYRWIQESRITYEITDSVIPDLDTPYFFRNSIIGESIYLAQNTRTLDDAFGIAVDWVTKGYNGWEYPTPEYGIKYTLYAYINNNIIERHERDGYDTGFEISIISYKIYDELMFTVLLSI